jgi:hypothetical protein
VTRLEELREEVSIDLEFMATTVVELMSLYHEVESREPTNRERAAAAIFLSQFYNGVENILKRICRYHEIPLPSGESWHIDLFNRFRDAAQRSLPVLFDDDLALQLSKFRKFRHFVHHGYSFQLDWTRLNEGLAVSHDVFERFKSSVEGYLATLTTL